MRTAKIRLFIILLITVFLFAGCKNDNDNEVSSVNDFAIFLVKDLTASEAMSKNLDDLPLETTPVLTDKEIKTYIWKEHVFKLKEGISLEEKVGKVPLTGKPFVVVVKDQRIYLGSFWNPLSSLYFSEIPTIYSMWDKESDKDTFSIRYGSKKDPRDDIRIYESLKNLRKITDE